MDELLKYKLVNGKVVKRLTLYDRLKRVLNRLSQNKYLTIDETLAITEKFATRKQIDKRFWAWAHKAIKGDRQFELGICNGQPVIRVLFKAHWWYKIRTRKECYIIESFIKEDQLRLDNKDMCCSIDKLDESELRDNIVDTITQLQRGMSKISMERLIMKNPKECKRVKFDKDVAPKTDARKVNTEDVR